MRKVSYTQMRAELSDILDAIRNGETIVVTQRGRPDTVIDGRIVESRRSGAIPWPGVVRFNRTIDYSHVLQPPKFVARSSFEDALDKTKRKYSKIIKALEDK